MLRKRMSEDPCNTEYPIARAEVNPGSPEIADEKERPAGRPLSNPVPPAYARLRYAPSLVSTRIFSPSLMNGGT